jgi:hypothetical protein
MTTIRIGALVATTALLIAGGGACLAQYDPNGRYVPSPGGVPSDPYARTVPNYPGTPGGAIGTPTLPRAAIPEPFTVPRLSPRETEALPRVMQLPPVLLTAAQCRQGWSRATGVSRVTFKRQCSRFERD